MSEALGLSEDGKINGNILKPTEEIIPKILTELAIKALRYCLKIAKIITKNAPRKPNIGAMIK